MLITANPVETVETVATVATLERWARHVVDVHSMDTAAFEAACEADAAYAESLALGDDVDTMDAPSDWDSGSVSFNPWV